MSLWASARRSPVIGASSLGASFAVHAVLIGAGAFIVSSSSGREASTTAPIADIAIEVAGAPGTGQPQWARPDDRRNDAIAPAPWKPGGREDPARPDMNRVGRGGSRRVDAPALNLAESEEGVTLSRDATSRIDRDQVQRLRTARVRSSDEDRRSLSDPMDLVFVASGKGRLKEQRPSANVNPDEGALRAPPFSALGIGVADPKELPSEDQPRRDPAGTDVSPGVGVSHGSLGSERRIAAALATGRPSVPRGPLAFVAEEKGPVQDRVDSEQEVAATIQSLIHASTAGGLPGAGSGGEEVPGNSGSGGPSGPGSQALPFGSGPGPFMATRDDDPRVSNYWRSVRAKIDPLWENAFPKWASLEGRQGWAVVSFAILSSGQVDDVKVTRPSGVPEFDENVRRAVLRASPFGPLPKVIAAPSMHWSITFDARNPAVR
jgi:TonB family protein